MTTVQPIAYTAHPDAWRRLASALALRDAVDDGDAWSEVDGDGILAIHRVDPADALAGTVELCLHVIDLDAAELAVAATGASVARTTLDDIGPILRVTSSEGVVVSVVGGARVARDGLVVQPIWYQRELDEPRRILEALGLRGSIASDAGGWIEFAAPGGGVVALHRSATAGVELGFATRDVDALAAALVAQGAAAVVVDEAYNRTVRVPRPEGGDLWINGPIDDMHGYHRLDG